MEGKNSNLLDIYLKAKVFQKLTKIPLSCTKIKISAKVYVNLRDTLVIIQKVGGILVFHAYILTKSIK